MVKKRRKYADEELYYSERAGLKTVLFFLILILIIVAGIFLLYNYGIELIDFSVNPQSTNASIETLPVIDNSTGSETSQFYPNMKFNHNKLSYNIDLACEEQKKEGVLEAFSIISDEVPKLTFYYSDSDSADIIVVCTDNDKYKPEENSKFFVAGEGGAREIIETGRFNVINSGVIYLYSNPENSIECNVPNTELHELMHVFGFNHSPNKDSLMYPYLLSCEQKLDESIINELNRLYSLENLPDLYFENISAIKKGRYLDFNFTIKNSGDIKAEDLSYSIIEDGKLLETKELNDLSPGAGIIMQVTNFKLGERDSEEIRIVVDYEQRIKEIVKKNNVAVLKFG